MIVEPEDKILAFLAQPENIEMAVDVARRVERLRDHFHAQFWTAVAQELHTRMAESEYKDAWMISDFNPQYRDNWVNIRITCQLPEGVVRKPEFITVTFEQGRGNYDYPFYFGIKWQSRNSQAIHRADTFSLKEFLQTNSYKPKDDLWMVYDNLGYSARSDKFVIRMAQEREQFIHEIMDWPWRLFILTADYLHTINQTTLSSIHE